MAKVQWLSRGRILPWIMDFNLWDRESLDYTDCTFCHTFQISIHEARIGLDGNSTAETPVEPISIHEARIGLDSKNIQPIFS